MTRCRSADLSACDVVEFGTNYTKRPDMLEYCYLNFRQAKQAVHGAIQFALRRKPRFVFGVPLALCRGYCGVVRLPQRSHRRSTSSEGVDLQLHGPLILRGFVSEALHFPHRVYAEA